uniref:Uncharacterized LOC100181165 n=1 Tax=Ciona intestinalis TaxID=7719 RepID=F7AZP5_CIOIN|nr:uncharacterized protein LOC100181165 [Ciona intestinalis]|eukprot:XP_002128783.1 uncharacterized protein LOC100181165 [Ciona intestinalis]
MKILVKLLFLFYLVVITTTESDVCFKYEPLWANTTGSTALTVVKVSPWEVCKLAEQCKPIEQDAKPELKTFSLSEVCPLSLPTPALAPTVRKYNKVRQLSVPIPMALETTSANDSLRNQHNYTDRLEICSILRSTQESEDTVYTAMCFLNDGWSQMCLADSNTTFHQAHSNVNAEDYDFEDEYCYIMKRSPSESDNGICNITILPSFNQHGVERSENKTVNNYKSDLVIFHFYQRHEMCDAVHVKTLVAKQAGQCTLEDENIEANPMCPRNSTSQHTSFSLASLFTSKFDMEQCKKI